MSGTSSALPSLDNTFGATFIGLLIAVGSDFLLWFTSKALTVFQVCYHYYQTYPKDRGVTRILVASLCISSILNTFHIISVAQAIYGYLITNFGHTEALAIATWGIIRVQLHVAVNCLIAAIVQVFFAYRVWKLSGQNWYLAATITLLAGVQLVRKCDYLYDNLRTTRCLKRRSGMVI
ncbi:hypothetical protein BD410DRAFT_800975 [Rickenella mellea]|uniref:Uncharacterized protein n=1 Tax=Rickenella mellea TaxID=50990 RepID=A0A4Y7QD25_9AGAM|nr:hypothetical protein BD410DRAFT_800975 [Rickenella mellea]